MKDWYKITKGQLASIWFFGIIGFLVAISESEYSGFAIFLSIFIPAILVFYTIGWRSFNKISGYNNRLIKKMKNTIPSRKKLIKSIVVIASILIVIFGIIYLVKIHNENLREEQLKLEYDQAMLSIDSLRTEFTACMKPTTDKIYQEELRSCNQLKSKIKADYDLCVTYTYVSPHASCIYDHDYEVIDCSKETIENKAQIKSLGNVPNLCLDSFNDIKEANSIIEEYSRLDE